MWDTKVADLQWGGIKEPLFLCGTLKGALLPCGALRGAVNYAEMSYGLEKP